MIGRWWRGAGCEVLDVPHKVGGACSAVKGSEGSVGTRKVRVCGIGHTRGLVEGSVVCLVCGGVVITRRFLGSMRSPSTLLNCEMRFFDRLSFEIRPELEMFVNAEIGLSLYLIQGMMHDGTLEVARDGLVCTVRATR
jgi:hypothetical protein